MGTFFISFGLQYRNKPPSEDFPVPFWAWLMAGTFFCTLAFSDSRHLLAKDYPEYALWEAIIVGVGGMAVLFWPRGKW
jgi:hypothetical protein